MVFSSRYIEPEENYFSEGGHDEGDDIMCKDVCFDYVRHKSGVHSTL